MKKDKTRFTIRFNDADPRQVTAMTALESAGRRKASFIADAVCDYLARHGNGAVAALPPITLLLQPTNTSGSAEETVKQPPVNMSNPKTATASSASKADDDAYHNDMRRTVMEGLSSFT